MVASRPQLCYIIRKQCLMVHINRQYPKFLPSNILGYLMGESLTGKKFTLWIHSVTVCLLPQKSMNKMVISMQELSKTKAQALKSALDQKKKKKKLLTLLFKSMIFEWAQIVVKNIFIITILIKPARNSPGFSRH